MASLITRAAIMVSGYAMPAYWCFKSVEMARPDVKQLQFWCQYWIIIAVLTVLERFGDTFISWLPMYSEAKLCFIFFLLHPKTMGTTYMYASFLKPIVSKHEPEIDRHLNEFWTRAGDMALHYWQRGSIYAQSRFVDVLRYLASQSPAPAPAPAAQAPVSRVYRPPPVYQNKQPQPSLLRYPQISSVYHDQCLGYQAEIQTNEEYEPSAPVLPAGYEAGPPTAAALFQQPVAIQPPPFQANQDVVEITDPNYLMSEPPVTGSLQRRRSRSRSRTYRP